MPTSTNHPDIIGTVRQRSLLFFRAILIALAVGGLLLIGRGLLDLQQTIVQYAVQLREALNIAKPQDHVDFYLLAAMLTLPVLLLLALLLLWRWYARVWQRRMLAVWGDRKTAKACQTIGTLPDNADTEIRTDKLRYVETLLASPAWADRRETVLDAAGEDYRYEPAAEAIFADIEKDVAARALAVGLVVGVGRNPFIDLATIAAASLETQLFVLARLGKRPSLRHWAHMANTCLASLFVNSYLNRSDAFAINLAIRKAALGIELAGEALEQTSEHLEDALHAEATDHLDSADLDVDEFNGVLGGVASLVGETALFSLTVGSVALQQIARFIERYGNDMVQGAIAGGVLHWQGVSLAADILALDKPHRFSPALTRNVRDAAHSIAVSAGELLRGAVQDMRTMYRKRRMMAVKGIGSVAKKSGAKVSEAIGGFFHRFKGDK